MSEPKWTEIICWVMDGKKGLPAKMFVRVDPVDDDPRLILRLEQDGQPNVEICLSEGAAEELAAFVDEEMSGKNWR